MGEVFSVLMESWFQYIAWAVSILFTAMASSWTLSIWLSRQFSILKDLLHTKIAQTEKIILDKLEYHERHDDQRFSDIKNEIWEMKLLNAAHHGMNVGKRKQEEF